jgi:hypothetical protein
MAPDSVPALAPVRVQGPERAQVLAPALAQVPVRGPG